MKQITLVALSLTLIVACNSSIEISATETTEAVTAITAARTATPTNTPTTIPVPPSVTHSVVLPTATATLIQPTSTATHTSIPPTATPSPTSEPTETATSTPKRTATRKPASSATSIPQSTDAPFAMTGSGSLVGCPILVRGMYKTIYGMDLVDWGVGANAALENLYLDQNSGAVIAVVNGQTVNLRDVRHIQVARMIIPRAIETYNDGISWVDVSPEDMLQVRVGTPVYFGNPGWGTTFKVGVGCP